MVGGEVIAVPLVRGVRINCVIGQNYTKTDRMVLC